MLIVVHTRKSLRACVLWDNVDNKFFIEDFDNLTFHLKSHNWNVLGADIVEGSLKVCTSPYKMYCDYLKNHNLDGDDRLKGLFEAAHTYASFLI